MPEQYGSGFTGYLDKQHQRHLEPVHDQYVERGYDRIYLYAVIGSVCLSRNA
jgi:hypothetical protein